MGTRNLEVVVLEGEVRVAQYSQWDGYPSGQGITALEFVRDEMNRDEFTQKVKQSSWITDEQLKQLWVDAGADPKSDMVSFDVSEKFSKLHTHLSRDCGADIFSLIQKSPNGLKLKNSINFAADSLFCEWAYLIDLDKNTFEVYKGFNETPLSESDRFYFLSPESEGKYTPIQLAKSFDLNNLPSNEEFLNSFKTEDDE